MRVGGSPARNTPVDDRGAHPRIYQPTKTDVERKMIALAGGSDMTPQQAKERQLIASVNAVALAKSDVLDKLVGNVATKSDINQLNESMTEGFSGVVDVVRPSLGK